jgi:hypothetical protein
METSLDKLFIGIKKVDNSFCEKIIKTTSDFYEIPTELLQDNTRKREVVQTRQTAMVLCMYLTKENLSSIGNQIGGKDHATVLHAKKTIVNLYDTDKSFRDKFENLVYITKISILKSVNDYFVCSICGNNEIVTSLLVNINTKKVVEEYNQDNHKCFCNKCDGFISVIPYHQYLIEKRKKEELSNIEEVITDNIIETETVMSEKETIEYLEKELNL